MPPKNKLDQIQKTIKFKFKDTSILSTALTHRSFLNENKNKIIISNERLEFLGDAVLELWTSHYLYNSFPNYPEGRLTNLRSLIVRTENLAQIANSINLGTFLFLSHGEEANGGRKNLSILADSFEALIGAIFLDSGQSASDQFLKQFMTDSIKKISHQKNYKDPKSVFQEIAQSKKGITPIYKTIKEIGPDHAKKFTVAVYLADQKIATGTGVSKQKAEENASLKATKILINTV